MSPLPHISADAEPADDADYDGLTLGRRDIGYIRGWMPIAEFFSRYYFRVRLSGTEHIPAGPAIFIGNHSGGLSTPDTAMTTHAFWSHCGPERPIYALIDESMFRIPILGRHLMKVGGIAATPRMAQRALASGASLLIYPGAGDEVYRSYADRNIICLHERNAYLKLAIRHGVPVIPVVCLGGHETLIVVDDGKALAESLGLDHYGIVRIPLTYSWPHGLAYGIHHNLPFPARIDIAIGAPISLDGFSPAATRDAGLLRACHRHVEEQMQQMLDRMVDARDAERERAARDTQDPEAA